MTQVPIAAKTQNAVWCGRSDSPNCQRNQQNIQTTITPQNFITITHRYVCLDLVSCLYYIHIKKAVSLF